MNVRFNGARAARPSWPTSGARSTPSGRRPRSSQYEIEFPPRLERGLGRLAKAAVDVPVDRVGSADGAAQPSPDDRGRARAFRRISLACCLNMCGAVHCSDIAILGVHRKPPMVDHDNLANMCEIPLAVASCPTGAIKATTVDDKKSVVVNNDKCMYCGNCFTMCPAMPLADAEGSGVAILVGGKLSNRITAPMFSKVVVPFLPNEAPRWPQTVEAVKKILNAYAKDAKKYERLGDWAARIGWERFFEKTDLPFTEHLIDDYRFAYTTWRTSTQFKF